MHPLRKYPLVLSLSAAIVLGSAAGSTPRAAALPGSADAGIISRLLELLFGIAAQSRISIPPGDAEESRVSIPPGEEEQSRVSTPPG